MTDKTESCPWKGQQTPLVYSAAFVEKGTLVVEASLARTVEQRTRHAEALLNDPRQNSMTIEERWAWERDVAAHRAAARKLDGETARSKPNQSGQLPPARK